MRYWNMARQRYCCGLARCWRALRLSADRAENAARKRALFGALIEESGSQVTRRWREQESTPLCPVRQTTLTRLPRLTATTFPSGARGDPFARGTDGSNLLPPP